MDDCLVEGTIRTLKDLNTSTIFCTGHTQSPPPPAVERCLSAISDLKDPWAFQRFSSLQGAIHFDTASKG